jgi:type IX secretion system PorP/SprF family membrane protein
MRKQYLLVIFLFVGSLVKAQQDPQFTQFMFDRVSYNPAAAAIDGYFNATAFYRNQWTGFEGAPKTGLLNVALPIFSIKSGVGISFYYDEIGQQTTLNGLLSYNYQLKLGGGNKLSFGVALGMYNSKMGTDWVATDGVDFDNAIPVTGESSTLFDASFGVVFRTQELYAGISATHLSGGNLKNLNIDLTQHFYAEVGYEITLPGETIKLIPNVLAKTDFASTQVDINLMAMWNNLFWVGATYRLEDAIAPMAGIQMPVGKGEIRIGYSYDITTSEIKNYSSGTHEIFLNYNMGIGKPLNKTKYNNVRFL